MTLFDEVQQLSSESHAKWFERYFKRYNLEEKLKTSAQKRLYRLFNRCLVS